MWTIHQLAPAHARFIHDLIIIKTRIKVKPSFARAKEFLLRGKPPMDPHPLSLLDKRNATVNYSNSR
ncbi:MAG: hypothetical protein DMF27_08525 [Verrucomicrobia bacterium]|nr:MAG: hypothetical protein DME37_05900 [Verrucomicrobiota bacterium]PYL76566.1 MAG: hypothetical protein DMF27_08525 [Verrucomicrobiota bacterium]PYM08320.1 MAG: hypothetical protein DMF15_08790 [Verrucomicrobiota bacterium]